MTIANLNPPPSSAVADDVEAARQKAIEALGPFARLAGIFDVEPDNVDYPNELKLRESDTIAYHNFLTLGHCRNAKAALKLLSSPGVSSPVGGVSPITERKVLDWIRFQAETWSTTGDNRSLRDAMALFVRTIDALGEWDKANGPTPSPVEHVRQMEREQRRKIAVNSAEELHEVQQHTGPLTLDQITTRFLVAVALVANLRDSPATSVSSPEKIRQALETARLTFQKGDGIPEWLEPDFTVEIALIDEALKTLPASPVSSVERDKKDSK